MKTEVKPTRKLTTEDGRPIENKTALLTAGPRGPALLTDHVFIEENAHFNREMVPDRVVHAKGAGAFGHFKVTHDISRYTKANIFSKIGKVTPLAVRFSIVVTNSGTPDSTRDVRGFSIKFYSEEGNWDLVGNNFPVFWIRDPMQFPSLIHSLRANPVTGLRAPDAFWDFASLRPETMHQLLMVFSDRGIPQTYRHLNGFGVNTFVLVNKDDESFFCKFHYISNQGIKNIPVHKVPMYAAGDPDHARRDLYNSIAEGKYPSWTMYIQVMTQQQFIETKAFNPLDDTKVWPHKDFPLIEVGQIVLDKNPSSFHGEVEQIAFCVANLVPGIEPSMDKVLQGRAFSYADTQRYRIGPNFKELPVNSPLSCSSNNYLIMGPMNSKYMQKDGPAHFPNSYSGPQPDKEKKFFSQKLSTSGLVDRYDDVDDNNFGQPKIFYEKVLNPDESLRLAANIAENLQHASSTTQNLMLEHLNRVSEDLGQNVKDGLNTRQRLRQEGKSTTEE
ncbi:catalase-like isoform X2 [Artemia franciscana]|uniref:catalase-like isoform X2 n=1 Tax=Artemia franciscana TaxID=6661 RepID=UPI0032D9EF10